MTTPTGFSTANAILNMVNSYISGWTSGIGDALDTVFTGNQPLDAPASPTNVTVKDADGKDKQIDLSSSEFKVVDEKTGKEREATPQEVLGKSWTATKDKIESIPLVGGAIYSLGWPVVTKILCIIWS